MRKLMIEHRKRVEELLNTIKEEKNGYKLGKPWRHSDQSLTCVVPVLKTSEDVDREYITITEAKKVEIFDTGDINKARVKNNEDKPIFIRLGEILAGDTQERAVTSSRIVFPGEEIEVPIACIHATKGIQQGAKLTFGGYAPNKEWSYIWNVHHHGEANQRDSWNLDQTYTFYADSVLKKHGFQTETTNLSEEQQQKNLRSFINQQYSDSHTIGYYDSTTGGSWSTPTSLPGGGTSSTPPGGSYPPQDNRIFPQNISYYQVVNQTDDLTAKHKEVNDLLDDIIKKVPLFENQVGLALIDPDGFKCLDCYDVKLSYKAVKEALVGKETAAISDKDEESVFEYKPEVAKKAITKVLDNKFEENIVHEEKEYKTITLDLDGFMGEAVLLKNKVIHLIITRKE